MPSRGRKGTRFVPCDCIYLPLPSGVRGLLCLFHSEEETEAERAGGWLRFTQLMTWTWGWTQEGFPAKPRLSPPQAPRPPAVFSLLEGPC